MTRGQARERIEAQARRSGWEDGLAGRLARTEGHGHAWLADRFALASGLALRPVDAAAWGPDLVAAYRGSYAAGIAQRERGPSRRAVR